MFAAIDYFEQRQLSYVVAINTFDERQDSDDDLRAALSIPTEVPIVRFDARSRESTMQVLIALVEHIRSVRRHSHLSSPAGRSASTLPTHIVLTPPDGPGGVW